MSLSVLLLSRYAASGASSRLRFYGFLPRLAEAGFDVTVAPLLDDAYVEALYSGRKPSGSAVLGAYARRLRAVLGAGKFDLLWIEKEVFPWFPAWFERVLLARRPAVLDYDDAWYLRYADHPSRMVRRVLGRKLESVARSAAEVIAGNRHLADWARAAGASRVVTIPTVVDPARYPLVPAPDGPFTIGWIGTPLNARYLRQIAEPLRILARRRGARLLVIGAGNDFTLPDMSVIRVPWSEQGEAAALARCHVGIMPLPDEAFERGKCGYKLIQSMALGRPVVASPVGANVDVVEDGVSGFLAADAGAWVSALERLADDRGLAERMGQAGRRRVEERFSIDAVMLRLQDALMAAAEAPAARNRAAEPF